jgi:hypothetical protein
MDTILGTTRQEYRQLDVRAKADNAGVILIGATGVGAATAWVELSPGESWGLNPQAYTAPAGGDFKIQPENIFVIGTDGNDQAYVAALQ